MTKRMPFLVTLLVTMLYCGTLPFSASANQPEAPADPYISQMFSPVASAASNGFCGPGVTSLSGTIAYYNTPGNPMAAAVEKAVRADSYYGIKPDQSLGSWLSRLKVRKAPTSGPGSRITYNTYCPGGNSVARYDGRYGVAGLTMLDICHTSTQTSKVKVKKGGVHYWKITTTTIERCKHAFKGYCRNIVKSVVFVKRKLHIRYKRIKIPPKPKPPKPVAPCECKQPPVSSPGCNNCSPGPTNSPGSCNGDNTNTGSGGVVGNCSVGQCVGNNVCNTTVTPPPCTSCGPPPPCTSCGPPPPKTCQELGNCPSPGLSITVMNDVDVGQTSDNYCAVAQLPDGHTGTLVMEPDFGSFGPEGTLAFKVTGTQKVCALIADGQAYTAPGEVPPGGTDTITVCLTDDVYKTSTTKSTTFRINDPPPPPV